MKLSALRKEIGLVVREVIREELGFLKKEMLSEGMNFTTDDIDSFASRASNSGSRPLLPSPNTSVATKPPQLLAGDAGDQYADFFKQTLDSMKPGELSNYS